MRVDGDTELGFRLRQLAEMHAAWSQRTFGTDVQRGPLMPLKHLEKEAREAQARPADFSEYADCLLLVLDASRRAGLTPIELVRQAHHKLQVNMGRSWPDGEPDEAVEHKRDAP